jgi:thymidylate kinase
MARDRHADLIETALLYAADLAERIEQVVCLRCAPACVVIADRLLTPMARAEARGVDPAARRACSGSPPPDAVVPRRDAEASLARRADEPDPTRPG